MGGGGARNSIIQNSFELPELREIQIQTSEGARIQKPIIQCYGWLSDVIEISGPVCWVVLGTVA